MIYTKELALLQIKELLSIYKGLQINDIQNDRITVCGDILINRTANNFHLCKKYNLIFVIPIGIEKLPYVIDNGGHINKNYPHKNYDGSLCLEVDIIVRMRLKDNFTLINLVSDYVEPYLFSYEYYQRYNAYPFGERSHGLKGVCEVYEELFNETNKIKLLILMENFSTHYRGHSPCPCGSGKKTRDCHGLYVSKIVGNAEIKNQIYRDYQRLKRRLIPDE